MGLRQCKYSGKEDETKESLGDAGIDAKNETMLHPPKLGKSGRWEMEKKNGDICPPVNHFLSKDGSPLSVFRSRKCPLPMKDLQGKPSVALSVPYYLGSSNLIHSDRYGF